MKAPKGSTLAGVSGWDHPGWAGRFYPEQMPREDWLGHYARQFGIVEIGASAHGLPDDETIARWRDATPRDFRFTLTAPRRITHLKKLGHCEAEIGAFTRRLRLLAAVIFPISFIQPWTWGSNQGSLRFGETALEADGLFRGLGAVGWAWRRRFDRDRDVVRHWGSRYRDPDDLAVALFISRHSGRSLDAIFTLRRGGSTWWGWPRSAW